MILIHRLASVGRWIFSRNTAEAAARDLRYGVRERRRNPGFSAIAIATLALGIGGITAMFSAFDAILVRPMPYAEADRLVMVWDDMTKLDITTKLTPSPAEWLEWRRLNTLFTDLALTPSVEATVSRDGDPGQGPAPSVSSAFWDVPGRRTTPRP